MASVPKKGRMEGKKKERKEKVFIEHLLCVIAIAVRVAGNLTMTRADLAYALR